MMSGNHFLPGYCRLRAEVDDAARFLNLAMERNILIWDAREDHGVMTACAATADADALHAIAEVCGCELTITGQRGLPALGRMLMRRRGIIAAALLAVALLVIFSHSILAVKIAQPAAGASNAKIQEIAASYGIAPTLWAGEVDYQAAADDILRQTPELIWVGFEKRGVFVTITLIPRETATTNGGMPGHIVAAKDGYVRELLVLRGQQVGQTGAVHQGDLLISGVVTPIESNGEPSAASFEVAAEGVVRGSVWYTATGYVSRTAVVPQPTERSVAAIIASTPHGDYLLWGSLNHNFDDWQTYTSQRRRLPLTNVELRVCVIQEVAPSTHTTAHTWALLAARADALGQLLAKLPKEARVVRCDYETVSDGEASVAVKATLETYEELGKFIPLESNYDWVYN